MFKKNLIFDPKKNFIGVLFNLVDFWSEKCLFVSKQAQQSQLRLSRASTYEWVSKSSEYTKVTSNDFVGSICMQTNIFTLKVDQIFDDPKESLHGVQNYHFWEMNPGYPTLWVWCRKIVETSQNMQNIAVFRLIFGFKVPLPNTYEKWQICPLFLSGPNTHEWVSKSP